MQYKTALCSTCEQPRKIINQKYQLCAVCNHKRLHPEPKQKEKKLQKKCRKRTKQQERIEKLLHLVYEEIAREREHKCTGCGTHRHLSHSHLIPRSRRKDLITTKRNIVYHCLTTADKVGCHQIWESGSLEERSRMLDFYDNMAEVALMDLEYYYLRGGQ
jgi:hypothetical protein